MNEQITVLPDESLGGLLREYREVKRKAAVGERIKVTDNPSGMFYRVGAIGTVTKVAAEMVRADGDIDAYVGHTDTDRNRYVVLEPTDIVYVDSPDGISRKYRMVDRKAAVGERILIVYDGHYARFENFTVKEFDYEGDALFDFEGEELYAPTDWYRVLEPVTSELSTRPATEQAAENIASLTAKIQTLETRLNALYDWHKRAAIDLRVAREDIVLIEEGVTGDIGTLKSRLATLEKAQYNTPKLTVTPPQKTAQQVRDEIVERAKVDVEALLSQNYPDRSDLGVWFAETRSLSVTDECEFVVDRDKRTVVALIRELDDKKSVILRGIAKCAPNDVFNAHIGKAIATRRALGLEVPAEYLSVPAPTEVRVGDVVFTNSGYGNMIAAEVTDIVANKVSINTFGTLRGTRIVDDSREGAELSASSAKTEGKGVAA